ncbi:MAG: cation-efflux pump [Deltaproteobacteria bacterium]|nr:cation-efflux pump [Deltaproteobacteria bacterium]
MEKQRVALVSVIAALLLTGTKVGVGLWTDSLGMLAEALHSGVDLAATVVTLWAVRLSGRPADEEHAYGHGKIENLSALFETALLLATCAWIIKEGIERLFFHAEVHVDANIWSFLVIGLSMAVDYSRSRALSRVAKKHGSQALEADALHFSTDIWSSLVVLLGLGGVLAARAFALPWLAKADAVAALGVAGVVVLVSLRLGRRAIADLLDTVPGDVAVRVARLVRVDGVREARHVRVRRSGPEIFVDLVLVVDRAVSLERSHEIASHAEQAIKRELPTADVVVHVEPAEDPGEDLLDAARRIAASHGAAAHNLLVYEEGGGLVLELHLELEAQLPLVRAHGLASDIDENIRRSYPRLARIVAHFEPLGRGRATDSARPEEVASIREALLRIPEFSERGITPQSIVVRRCGSEFSLSFRCVLPGATSVKEAHDFTDRIERALRDRIPNLGRVMAQTEPDA